VLSLDPGGIVLVALLVGAYARAVHVLARRGYRVTRGQQIAWYTGVAMIAIGLLGPLDGLARDLLTAHMAQHLLIADLAAPFLLAGIRTPVLYFIPPRWLLVKLAHRRRLRAAFRFVRRPLVALPIFVAVFYTWHFAFAFQAALRHGWVHALQHESFLIAALLVWWPLIEPLRRPMPGELWKAGYIFAVRMLAMFVGVAFVISRHPAYSWYADKGRTHGLTPLFDQQLAGGLMMTMDIIVMVAALAYFFWQASLEADRQERAELLSRAG
jgi:cytochrome c oxidase assembly factor CtaG